MGKKHPKDPESWKIVRRTVGKQHTKRCNSGYYREGHLFSQVHHIVPVSSMQDSYISDALKNDDDLETVRNCLKITAWNINDSHNTIGLPIKRAFATRPPRKWGGLPCHTVDHNPYYTRRLDTELKKQVWEPALDEAEECEVEGVDIKAQLRACSSTWRGFLVTRGSVESGGTKHCWRKRHEIDDWYVPFSMHPGTPNKRKPPPSWEDFSDNFAAAMKKLLKMKK